MVQQTTTRILLKISGEALNENEASAVAENSFDIDALNRTADKLIAIQSLGIQLAVVCGGGNIMRGSRTLGTQNQPSESASESYVSLHRADADRIGMLSTIMNALALQSIIIAKGHAAKILSAIPVEGLVEGFNRYRANSALKENKILLLSGGLGQPYFTTDSTTVIRALELKCDYIVKATKVDGVYDCDPEKNPDAQHYAKLSFQTAIDKKLKIMDQTAFILAQEHDLKIAVLNFNAENPLKNLLNQTGKFTIISNENH